MGTRAFALDHIDEQLVVLSFPASRANGSGELSAAEREVAMLVIRGLSNRQIAAARGTKERTVANQIASIFRKLGVGSRVELAARL
ncbi:MAG: helix-turn-helix transcriptional regulator [Polyangiaceae bacterium]